MSSNWKNVNNWHWIDKDCTKWAHAELRERLLRIKGVEAIEQLEGEVSVAQRKGKLRHLYDLSIKLKLKSHGHLTIRDWLSDTTPDDQELAWAGDAMPLERKQALIDAIWEMMRQFEIDLMQQHGEALLVSAKQESAAQPKAEESSPPEARKSTSESFPEARKSTSESFPEARTSTSESFPEARKSTSESSFKKSTSSLAETKKSTSSLASFSEQVEFNCRAQDLLTTLTRGERIRAWSRSANAQDLEPDREFCLFDGNVRGRLISLSPPTELRMEWKLSHWNHPSIVSIRLQETADRCILHLEQKGIPQADLDRVKHNWTNYYWNPIKMIFGYGYIIH